MGIYPAELERTVGQEFEGTKTPQSFILPGCWV